MPRKSASDNSMFEEQLRAQLRKQAPLADRMRPTTLDEIVGQEHLLGAGRPLRILIESDRLSSVVLWGPPGTGKTTLARVIAEVTNRAFVPLSAVSAGVKDVRDTVEVARQRLAENGRPTILFLDEVHRFNKSQQDALLPSVEDGTLTLIGATTENPYFELNKALLSRSTVFRLEALDEDSGNALLQRALDHEGATADADGLRLIADRGDGDGRVLLTALEVGLTLAHAKTGAKHMRLEDAEAALGTTMLRYGVDEHYDVISAFIKSLRGSDVDAAMHYLARMLEAGEDARFIARRLVILASEDVGMADPMALVVADAAARAVEFVGLPEAQLNLSQAVVYLATAPKSNRSAEAIWLAREDVRNGFVPPVPAALRSGHPLQKIRHGDGQGYLYPHAEESGWVEQEYVSEAPPRPYYEPSEHGYEAEVRRALKNDAAGFRPTNSGDATT